MIFDIFDYEDNPLPVDIEHRKIEEIDSILVAVITGDELISIFFKDGTEEEYDGGTDRLFNYYDGFYDLKGEQIQEWMEYPDKHDSKECYSYDRLKYFK